MPKATKEKQPKTERNKGTEAIVKMRAKWFCVHLS